MMKLLKPVLPPGMLTHRCRAVLRQLAASDSARAFCYFWGNGLPIPAVPSGAAEEDKQMPGIGSGFDYFRARRGAGEVAPSESDTWQARGSSPSYLFSGGGGGGSRTDKGRGGEKVGGWAPRPGVARPMDFRVVDVRLSEGAYGESHEAFASDVRLIWTNVARTYDRAHPVALSAALLAPRFERLYQEQVLSLFGLKRGALQSSQVGPSQRPLPPPL
eukprot:jgi/Mesen1/4118/ME000216S03368